jgi:hypothetical protein
VNIASTLVYGYGTHESVLKSWDTRGRGRKDTTQEGIKRFYHGTVLPSAKKILQEGLAPQEGKAFQVNKIPTSKKGYVYITSDKKIARLFAEARAKYDATAPGEQFTVGNFTMTKREEAQPSYITPSNEKPVVLEIDVPAKVAASFVPDPDSDPDPSTNVAYLKKGIIPKEFIKKVSVLNYDPKAEERMTWKDFTPDNCCEAAAAGKRLFLVYVGPIEALKMHLKAGE